MIPSTTISTRCGRTGRVTICGGPTSGWKTYARSLGITTRTLAAETGTHEQAKDPRGYEERSLCRECRAFCGADGGAACALGGGSSRWGSEGPEAAPGAGQAAGAREGRTPPRPRHGVPGALAPGGLRDVRWKGSGGRDNHGDRTRLGARGYGGRQRRDREGRHVLPDDGQKAPAGAGDSGAELSALHLPRRFGGRVPAVAGRGLP